MKTRHLVYVISSHGYGHAARACAVMEAMLKVDGNLHFHILTEVPQWFFKESLPIKNFTYHRAFTDVGLAQKSPFEEDIEQTIKNLRRNIPFSREFVRSLADDLQTFRPRVVITDISVLGNLLSRELNIPSVLIENFTWDEIYRHYLKNARELQPFIDYFSVLYNRFDLRIQTQPILKKINDAQQVAPIARRARSSAAEIRQKLSIPDDAPAVLISTGGIKTRHSFLPQLKSFRHCYFIVPHDVEKVVFEDNLRVLPHHSKFFHPDLVNASDVVVCKAGYSTVAEAYLHSKKIILIKRKVFPESRTIEAFVQKELVQRIVEPSFFDDQGWQKVLEEILKEKVRQQVNPNGAQQVAKILTAF